MQRLLIQAFFLVAAMFIAAQLLMPAASRDDRAGESRGEAGVRATADPVADGFDDEETVLRRDASGQFRVNLLVNGQDVPFLVDTGADVVALTVEEADRLGLGVQPGDMRPIMRTASGVGYGAPVAIERIELGDASFGNVEGVVAEGLDVNLLGQSLLRRLGKVELRGDRMVLRHR